MPDGINEPQDELQQMSPVPPSLGDNLLETSNAKNTFNASVSIRTSAVVSLNKKPFKSPFLPFIHEF